MVSIQKVRRIILAVVCASAAAVLLTAPASARADDTYAAIAYSPKTGAYGYGDKFDSREKAEKAAVANCKADDAQVIVWCVNNWCAMAVGDNNSYGFGYDKDGDVARKTALTECSKHGTNAPILISVSSDGQVQKGSVAKAPGGDAPPPPPAAAGDDEKELARLINAYRAANNLPAVPVSKKLTLVAETHARDCAAHPGMFLHDWSQSDKWTGGDFRKNPHIMWDKPKEIAGYPSAGYENAAGGGDKITAEEALKLWKSDDAHNDVILNKGIWKDMTWKAMGVGVYKGYANVWFGVDADSD